MNKHEYISGFIESRLRANATFARFLDAGKLAIHYDNAGENPRRPYLRYSIQRPEPATERDLLLRLNVFKTVVNVNIVGNSWKQIRPLADAVLEEFDGKISPDEHVEDCTCSEALESLAHDASTGMKIYETAQEITFNYIEE